MSHNVSCQPLTFGTRDMHAFSRCSYVLCHYNPFVFSIFAVVSGVFARSERRGVGTTRATASSGRRRAWGLPAQLACAAYVSYYSQVWMVVEFQFESYYVVWTSPFRNLLQSLRAMRTPNTSINKKCLALDIVCFDTHLDKVSSSIIIHSERKEGTARRLSPQTWRCLNTGN